MNGWVNKWRRTDESPVKSWSTRGDGDQLPATWMWAVHGVYLPTCTVGKGEKREQLYRRNLTISPSRCSRSTPSMTSHVEKMSSYHEEVRRSFYLHDLPPLKPWPLTLSREDSSQRHKEWWGSISPKVTENQQRLRNCHSLEEPGGAMIIEDVRWKRRAS